MKRFFDGMPGETPDEERLALMADIVHLREQCKRYECDKGLDDVVGGVGGLLMREKVRLFDIYRNM